MEVFEAVRTVLAVRSYQDKPIPADTVRKIIEAGRLSGTSMNAQPVRLIAVDDRETIQRLGSLAKTGPYTAQAPLAVVVAMEKTKFAESDASRAVQSMMLTAWEDGIGSNWVGFYGLNDVQALLGVPEELEVFAIIPFGYPAQAVGKGKKQRKPLSEVAFRNRFGQPFA
jgi:nitroreductase